MIDTWDAPDEQQRSGRLRTALLAILTAFIAILCSFITLSASADSKPARYLQIDVHSGLAADYSSDSRGQRWDPASDSLVVDVIRDDGSGDLDLMLRLTEIQRVLQTPVPLAPSAPNSSQAQATPAQTPTNAETSTPLVTTTVTPTPEASLTLAPWITPSLTPTPTWTASPTWTLTPNPTPTFTLTPTPTNTLTPTPSDTPTPLPTSTPNVCVSISMSGFTFGASDARTSITNGTSSSITITRIYFSWPSDNGPLKEIKLDGRKIWEGSVGTPVNITSGWTAESRTIAAYDSVELKLRYDKSQIETGHSVSVFFSNGCVASSSN